MPGPALTAARRRLAPPPARDQIIEHLEACHGIAVAGLGYLDHGVYRVDRRDGPPWVARVFPAVRPQEAAAGDAEILELLAGRGYGCERPATPDPVSDLGGHAVLVTEFAQSVPRTERRDAIKAAGGLRRLGEMLADLHTLPAGNAATARRGGGWHHLVDGTGPDELAAARALLAECADGPAADDWTAADRAAYDVLRRELDEADDGAGLPVAVTHPDFVLRNVIAAAAGGMVVVDWTGAGTGPRAWTLAFLLWAEGARNPVRVDIVSAGYRPRVQLEPAELDRLPAMMRARPTVLAAWSFCLGRSSLADAARAATEAGEIAAEAGQRAVAALRG